MWEKTKNEVKSSLNLVRGLNLNVKIYFSTFALVSFVQTPMYLGSFFLVYLLGGNDQHVGIIFGISSLFGIAGLIISGIYSDKWRRDVFIWISSAMFIISSIFYLYVNTLFELFIIQMFFAIASSLFMPAGTALIADCTSKGTRSKIYTIAGIVQQICTAIGGVIAYSIIHSTHDVIDLTIVRPMLRVSIIVIIIASFLGFFINDKRSLQGTIATEETEMSIEERRKNAILLAQLAQCKTFKDKLKFYRTPILIVAGDFLIAFGAGISIPYLPRFFEAIYHRKLSELNLIFSTAPLLTAAIAAIALFFAKKLGRAKAVFIIELIAVLFFIGFIVLPPFWVVIVVYILRQAFMNAGWPLINAIVMDVLPSNQRGTFSAIDSLAFTAFNSVSQPIGGLILHRIPYPTAFQYAFGLTAIIYLFGTLILLFIKEGNIEKAEAETIIEKEVNINPERMPLN